VIPDPKVRVLLEHSPTVRSDLRPARRRTRSSRNHTAQLDKRVGRRCSAFESREKLGLFIGENGRRETFGREANGMRIGHGLRVI
jgi:hypothetical protein